MIKTCFSNKLFVDVEENSSVFPPQRDEIKMKEKIGGETWETITN